MKYAKLDDILAEVTAHNCGMKRVFLRNPDTDSSLTQFAHGVLQMGEETGFHSHKTMEEYFFFIQGNGIFDIESESVQLSPSTFVRIPPGVIHNLKNDSSEALTFVYFGIAL